MSKYVGKGTVLRLANGNPATVLTSGLLVYGYWYQIRTYVADDDFTNVGATQNATGHQFLASGTTPTHWAHGSSLVEIGYKITQVGDIEADLGERSGLLDTTTHDNTSGVRDKLDVGFKEPAKISFEMLLDPDDAVHNDMIALEATGGTRYLLMILPDAGAGQWSGLCRVAALNIGAPVSDKLSARVVLELLGAFNFST